MDITATLNRIKEEKANPLYTPHIGCEVQWSDRGEGDPIAAIVTAIERPGVVKLTILRPNAHPGFKNGVQWAKTPAVLANPHDPSRVHNGTWDYAPEVKPPKSHEQLHIRELERREDAAHKQKIEYEKAEAARIEREAAKKKPQPATV